MSRNTSTWEDTGTYETEKWRDDEVIFTLTGRPGGPLGEVRLALIRTEGSGEKSNWLLHRMKDQRPGHWSSSSIARHKPNDEVEPITERPMLATAGTLGLLTGEEWALEWKWDGIRVLARVAGRGVRLLSRNGIDITARYPEFAALPDVLDDDALVDGEIVALDEAGRPSFGLLQRRMGLTKPREIERVAASVPARLLLFDVLEVAGEQVIDEPYIDRRAQLERLVKPSAMVPIEMPGPAEGTPAEALEESRRLGLEGIVAKRPDSPYRPGVRSDAWVKLKVTRTQEVVIGGYRRGAGTRQGRIRSLLLGIPGDRGLDYVGRVGSGFREIELDRLLAALRPLEQTESPFVEVPAADAPDAVWVRPELVGEIELSDWTGTGVARHPRWRGLRPDKAPDEVRREP